ncbi:hypothetical protein PIROE2DRAFT_67372 [Piromyces sp. E2]|nr:hypothetical protein PIROE2DRAFT_67372 [Piromyces sp. E2]|eukprot:OUM63742.1 hypothetical protein PIROE2DRAFT_67372 [Piromyces sp. E2]
MQDCLHWADQKDSPADHYFTDNLMSHPQIKERYDVILAIASREIFDTQYITPYIQSMVDLIREDVEWSFNMARNIDTTYDEGIVQNFTMDDFQENLTYDKTNYNKEERMNEETLTLSEFIDLRGDSCRAYTSNVNTSNNQNISDDVNITEFVDEEGAELNAVSSATLSMKQCSLLFILAQIILLLL